MCVCVCMYVGRGPVAGKCHVKRDAHEAPFKISLRKSTFSPLSVVNSPRSSTRPAHFWATTHQLGNAGLRLMQEVYSKVQPYKRLRNQFILFFLPFQSIVYSFAKNDFFFFSFAVVSLPSPCLPSVPRADLLCMISLGGTLSDPRLLIAKSV